MDIQTIIATWQQQPAKWVASPQDILDLEDAAKRAKGAPAHLWADVCRILEDYSGLKSQDVAKLVRRLRIVADLGIYPGSYEEFVDAFVASRGFSVKVDGTFIDPTSNWPLSNTSVRNQIATWTGNFQAFTSAHALTGAWNEWRRLAHQKALQACYERVRFDPAANPGIYDQILDLILHPDADTPDHRTAAKAVLRNFVHRVKNAMRGKPNPRSHIMPYLMGAQGGGKSTLVEHLLTPVEEAMTSAGFDMLEDQSRMIDLALMPIIFFDEMANASRQEMNKVKGLMTSRAQQFRQLYQEAGKLQIISTFIGCGNFDLDTLIKDPSGNRRFFQINVRDRFDLAAIQALDAAAFWRSVDENQQPPAYVGDTYSVIQAIQTGQRYRTPVEQWISKDSSIPENAWTTCDRLYRSWFDPWRTTHFPHERYDISRFGKEMKRCIGETVEHKQISGISQYRFTKVAEVIEDERDGRIRDKLGNIHKEPRPKAA